MTQVIVNKNTKAQYALLAKVGEGAYADVYKGQNLATKQIVAIKKMKTMKAADSAMAQKEVELMKSLKHKNIVRWIDDFRSNGIWFIVLEYCGKGDLQKYKEKIGKIPEYHCKAFIRGILEALIQLHSEKRIVVEINGERKQIMKKKIAHRDLKLPNILINDQYQLKLADFGFSKDFQDGWLQSFCGTPLTMAPEVLKRENYNQKCDVWSLGVIAYFLLYNKYPFMPNKVDGPGLTGLTKAVTNRLHAFDPKVQVSEIGKDFINKCLQKSKDKRPFSHELLNHSWWEKSTGWTAVIKQIIGVEEKPDILAKNQMKLLFFGACVNHLKRIYEGMMLADSHIQRNIALLQKYYADHPKTLACYLQLITAKLQQTRQREILLTYEQQVMGKTEKRQFPIKVSQIKCSKQFEKDIQNVVPPLSSSKSSKLSINPVQELVLFLIEETEKLMQSFNQTEVDEKVVLFKSLAKFITIHYEETLISTRWGEREDINELGIYVLEAMLQLTPQQVVAMINEEAVVEEDLESIWVIEHHIAESPNNTSTEHELGKLVLSVLNIPSNFNIDKTMQTELLEFKNQELHDSNEPK